MVAFTKEGAAVDVELTNVAVRDDGGELSGFVAVHRDVTERKRAQAALTESHRLTETILESITDAFYLLDHDWKFAYVNRHAADVLAGLLGQAVRPEDFVGRSVWEMFPAVLGTVTELNFRRAMREQRSTTYEFLYPPTGTWFEIHVYPSQESLSVYFRDIDERRRATDELERSAGQQAVLAELGQRALAGHGLQSVMDQAVDIVARTLDVELVGVAEVLPGEEQVLLRAGVGWREGAVGVATELAGSSSLMGYTVLADRPVISEDVADDERFRIFAVLSDHEAVSAATVVIAGRGEPFGGLGAFSKQRRCFSADDVNFLQAVANVISTAAERVRFEQRVIDVRDPERRRIARDLDDEVLQELTDALAQAAGEQVADQADAADRRAELIGALKRTGAQLRGAIFDLFPTGEDDQAFPKLLEALVDVTRSPRGDCELHLELGDGVPSGPLGRPGTEVIRIVREAVDNARRHAGARHIHIRAGGSQRRLSMEIEDDGRGFEPGSPGTGGAGIDDMRERAALIGGELAIDSRPGTGSRVRFDLPLTDDGDAREGTVRVLLVEDHAAVREAIAAMFDREQDFEVVGQAASLAEARRMLEEVDVAVVDLGLPDGDGADLIPELRTASPQAQTVVLSASLDRADMARAVQNGAAATIDKTAHLDEVVDAVRRLRAGETLLGLDEVVDLLRFARRQREREREDRQALASLTTREREVLRTLAEGLDSQAIADRLHIALRTERNHIANILAKLGVHSQLQALVFALRYGVVELSHAVPPSGEPT